MHQADGRLYPRYRPILPLYSEGRDVDLIFRGDNSDTGIIKNTQIFCQDIDLGPFAYQLLRRPAKELEAGGRDIPGHPIQAGAADDIDAVIHKDLEVDCVFARDKVPHLLLLGIPPGIFILLPVYGHYTICRLRSLSSPNLFEDQNRAHIKLSLCRVICHVPKQTQTPPRRPTFHRQVWFNLAGRYPPSRGQPCARIMAGMNIQAIQAAIREAGHDGWLFYDYHHRDPIAGRILGLDQKAHVTRRWYYFVPAAGEPRKLVHRIEQARLDALPGTKAMYSSWQELASGLEAMLAGARTLAMQYSPNNAIMYVSMVDAGTVEFLRGLGKQIVSSAILSASLKPL